MSELVDRICALIGVGEIRIFEHSYDELADDELTVRELLTGVSKSKVVEEYPN